MAVAIPSSSLGTAVTTSPYTAAKPTGLAVGDLMLSHQMARGGTGTTVTGPGGWAEINTGGTAQGTQVISLLCWKIADAADVAASSFSFTSTNTGATAFNRAAILRITGHDPTTPIDTSSHLANPATNTIIDTTTITPSVANTLLCFFASLADDTACDTYLCANNDPAVWTEEYDDPSNVGGDGNIVMAYGDYAPASATGTVQCTSAAIEQAVAHAVAIAPATAGAFDPVDPFGMMGIFGI